MGRFLLCHLEDWPVQTEAVVKDCVSMPSVVCVTVCRKMVTGGFPGDGFLE